ncbi:sigma-B regulation protein RsbU (phosphoserine phosphatase) [Luteimonas cucumeris]|uniref:Sigma-B regulation protein RsbU (Phosphoserine phosphatase) n=1 Tax=Luteimonas cucumeris TaxID=985012 RepID=A0A562LEI8_9GAMM|nr:SpoIIE family protein phosphatase [Luteimonas cucumeris]TWI05955.1 sigma-B regulation protein RsbU (phosphoserine phosphatase) [Luteimonas cucumeris]
MSQHSDASASTPAHTAHGRGDDRVRWYRSLRTRLLLWTSLGAALLLLAGTLLIYASLRELLVAQSRQEVRGLAEQGARTLEATLGSVTVSARTLAASVRGIGMAPRELDAVLRAAVEGDPDIAGAMLILEPGALADGDPGHSWYVRRDGDGYYVQPMLYAGYDYHDQPWWPRTIEGGRPWWSEPYRNNATGSEYFVTYNLPLRRTPDAAPVGMVSLDVPVQRLRELVATGAENDPIQRLLLSPERLYVLHPRRELEMTTHADEQARQPRYRPLQPLLDAARARRAAELDYPDPRSGDTHLALVRPIGDSGWTLGLSVSENYVLGQLRQTTRGVIIGGLAAIALMLLLLQLVARRITGPLASLTESARHFDAGEFDRPLPHTGRDDEVGLMARAFDHARGSIRTQMAQIEEMATARQKLDSELSIARDIQRAMLPGDRMLRHGTHVLQAQAVLEPAKAVGGDFYCFFERGDAALWFAIGDVSDKGVPAALFMARSITVLEVAAGRGGTPAEALREAAARLAGNNDTCMFATVLCGVVDLASGELILASAGHEPPLLRRADGDTAFLALEPGPPLGFEADVRYDSWQGRLRPGDALVAYTDGITEAFDVDLQAFGSERLLQVAGDAADPATLCARIVAAAHAFAGGAPQSDDLTVLALSFASVPVDNA